MDLVDANRGTSAGLPRVPIYMSRCLSEAPLPTNLFLVLVSILRTGLSGILRSSFLEIDYGLPGLLEFVVQCRDVFGRNLTPSRQLLLQRFIQFFEGRYLLRGRGCVSGVESAKEGVKTAI